MLWVLLFVRVYIDKSWVYKQTLTFPHVILIIIMGHIRFKFLNPLEYITIVYNNG